MNSFDYLAIAWLIAAALNGYRQGLAKELYRLVRIAVALIAGSSLYGLISGWATQISGAASTWLGPVIFAGGTVGVWLLLRSLRKWIEAWLLLRTPKKLQAAGGAVVALAKTVLLLGGVIATFHLATWIPGHALVAERSIASKIAGPFLADRPGK